MISRDNGVCRACGVDTYDIACRLLSLSGPALDHAWGYLQIEGFERNRQLAEADHIEPLDEGGSDCPDNMQTLCMACHKKKTKEQNHRRGRLNKLVGKKQRQTMAHLRRIT